MGVGEEGGGRSGEGGGVGVRKGVSRGGLEGMVMGKLGMYFGELGYVDYCMK